jgi:hypothetical protein
VTTSWYDNANAPGLIIPGLLCIAGSTDVHDIDGTTPDPSKTYLFAPYAMVSSPEARLPITPPTTTSANWGNLAAKDSVLLHGWDDLQSIGPVGSRTAQHWIVPSLAGMYWKMWEVRRPSLVSGCRWPTSDHCRRR